ncbi:cold-shock protein [Paenibacillus sp. Leaf72]|uniref:cold-shock protein n=1 Tax=Paenibacillus sp. Leaf72 TaxID=1736234 RepID=UPI0006FF53CB|nr:cold shock domain-containing protein [Paenibacillus sp. Leaf72]KQN97589.1 hypothetical protein ASF12_20465 [Paenibacillus sp. Leaf72]
MNRTHTNTKPVAPLKSFAQRQFEPVMWPENNELTGAAIKFIGPSLGKSPRKPAIERREPDYQPVSSSKHTDKVRYYNAEKGFGKIGEAGLFFHVSAVVDGNASFIREGVTVAYEESVDRRGRPCAVDVQLVEVSR